MNEVDSLHEPSTVIKEAQILAAKAYGADYSFFLVNGTTGGNQAMILSTCDPGDKIIIPRNAHKSVISAVILAGAEPVYIMPKIDETSDLILNLTPEQVEETLPTASRRKSRSHHQSDLFRADGRSGSHRRYGAPDTTKFSWWMKHMGPTYISIPLCPNRPLTRVPTCACSPPISTWQP